MFRVKWGRRRGRPRRRWEDRFGGIGRRVETPARDGGVVADDSKMGTVTEGEGNLHPVSMPASSRTSWVKRNNIMCT